MSPHYSLLFVIALIPIVGIHYSYAQYTSGPQVPSGFNTIEQYCSSGTCVTPNNWAAVTNNTDATNSINFNNETSQGVNGIPLPDSRLIGIQLSESCIKLEEQHIKSDCPTYDKLFFMDDTNEAYSGQWINDTWYHRIVPNISTIFVSNVNKYVVMVDPDPDYTARAKMIIIQPDNFTWINPDENGTNSRLIQHANRFITASCEGAIVAPNIWLINDTVHYLENGCTATGYNDTQIIHRIEIPFSWNNPYSSLHYSDYLKTIYHSSFLSVNQTGGNSLGDCIHFKCNYKDPYSNW